MKEVSQEKFEEDIKSVIEGKVSLKQLVKKYITSYDYIHQKILELSYTNRSLYERYIEKFPYKPKTNQNISARGIVIELIKSKATIGKLSDKYGIPARTIDRRIKSLEAEDPELYSLYKRYRKNPKDEQIDSEIRSIPYEPVISEMSSVELKESEIRGIIESYEKIIADGTVKKEDAARQLGYTPQQIAVMKQKLIRIAREGEVKTSGAKSFRKSYEVEKKEMKSTEVDSTKSVPNLEKEDDEIGGN